MGCGKGKGSLAADGQHVGVDVGNDNGDIGIAIELVSVLKVTEGNITSSTSDIENTLRLARGVRSTRVQRGDKVVPRKSIVSTVGGIREQSPDILP